MQNQYQRLVDSDYQTVKAPHHHLVRIPFAVDLFALQKAQVDRYPFLLESASNQQSPSLPDEAPVERNDRFSILFAFPQEKLSLTSLEQGKSTFLDELERQFLEHSDTVPGMSLPHDFSHLPFYGGWFVFLSYEIAQEVEPTLQLPITETGLPHAYAQRVPVALVVDHFLNETIIVAESAYADRVGQVIDDLNIALASKTAGTEEVPVIYQSPQEETPGKFIERHAAVKQYIIDGDVFQVNLSRGWQLPAESSQDNPFALYQTLRSVNPAPFAGLAKIEDGWVVSSSPERLVSVRHNQVEARPIAGSRPRSDDLEADLALIAELHKHPKEQAEHIMLIDLIRNDLGRVSAPGSVQVNELMVNETYATVHHIVSNVRGQLKAGVNPVDVIKAVFPGGTITGCPKVRCMEIIAELEQESRGAYTGSMGYINLDGSMDLNILIRTLTQSRHQQRSILRFRAGAGLVFDSVAENELSETRFKAKGVLNAIMKHQPASEGGDR